MKINKLQLINRQIKNNHLKLDNLFNVLIKKSVQSMNNLRMHLINYLLRNYHPKKIFFYISHNIESCMGIIQKFLSLTNILYC